MNDHFSFYPYVTKSRWNSYWHQISEILKLKPKNILEIGCGAKITSQILASEGIQVKTLDIDPLNNPDILGSATNMPLENNSFDCVCAFQVLEHMPWENSLASIGEMKRVAKKNLVLSLPNQLNAWSYSIDLPFFGNISGFVRNPRSLPLPNKYDGRHYWEVGNKGFSYKEIIKNITYSEFKLIKEFRINQNTYHHFFVFETVEH